MHFISPPFFCNRAPPTSHRFTSLMQLLPAVHCASSEFDKMKQAE